MAYKGLWIAKDEVHAIQIAKSRSLARRGRQSDEAIARIKAKKMAAITLPRLKCLEGDEDGSD